MSDIQGTANTDVPIYNLKAVVMETGLKPPTIRAWERRYGMPQPQRSAGGHRLYSQRDIDTLKWLIARQAEGMSISHAVELWQALHAQGEDPLIEEEPLLAPTPLATAAAPLGTEIAELRQEWVGAGLAFDRLKAEQVLARAFALFPPEFICIELLQAGLAEVGALWYDGEASVQQEHFMSALSVQRMDMLIAAAPPPTRLERIIVASAQDDYHVFSPLLLTYLLRRRGWDVLYLGADVPAAELQETVSQTKPHALIISAQLLSTAASLVDMTSVLARYDIPIGYGGLIFNMMPQLQERIPAHYLGPTIEGALPLVEQLVQRQPASPTVRAIDAIYPQALEEFYQRRSLIESHVWSSLAAAGKTTSELAELNLEMAGIINAALKFGDSSILSRDMEWIHYLMTSYRLPEEVVQEYIDAYYEAAKVHLGGSAKMIVDWLGELAGS
jgi:DNA-binding transcriptional MerR regulator/methylmalonyl-CoA mutase cobalamin-binding subunit